ncbi:MAG: gfo/Idh/MocA family oxidoreductase, partial [Clostridia bacterium]|nr:gfo/Idh/MocA family oxidoreductase [Clostridia bacterium]
SFEGGARAIVETGLVSPFSPQICELYGTNGAILCEAGRLRIRTNETHGWLEPELPKALPEPFRQFIDSVLYGAPVAFGTSEARELTLMMQKAYEAERLGRRVSF